MEYNLKRNKRNTFRIGSSLQSKRFEYDFKAIGGETPLRDVVPGFEDELISYLDNSGGTEFLQAYFQWQNRFASQWQINTCLLYTSPSPRDQRGSRMPSSA